jgi:hypothetical protein
LYFHPEFLTSGSTGSIRFRLLGAGLDFLESASRPQQPSRKKINANSKHLFSSLYQFVKSGIECESGPEKIFFSKPLSILSFRNPPEAAERKDRSRAETLQKNAQLNRPDLSGFFTFFRVGAE